MTGMSPTFTVEQERFRSEVRAWLREHAPTAPVPEEEDAQVDFLRTWQATLAANRLVGPHWPEEYGGRGLAWAENFILQEEMARARVPEIINRIAVNLVGPVLMTHGSAEQKARYLPAILSAEEIWCQLFSEPDAGSDLRSMRTTASKVSDGWVVHGTKVWSSWAHHAKRGVLLARTEQDTGRPGAIGYFLVDMGQEGIEVRPLRQLTGETEFCETFLDGVFVGDDDVIGDPANGWKVMHTTISYERSMSPRQLITHANLLDELLEIARKDPLTPEQRQRIARAYAELTIYRLHLYRVLTDLGEGGSPSDSSSVIKLFWSEMAQRMHELSIDMLGMEGITQPSIRQRQYLYYRACTIFAGTSEIQRDTIGHRVLGLPREPPPAETKEPAP
ncbi:MAG TPA: acyl-CoA dehydrogenase family protein [Acidimicrobiales bacterium]|nr:acyl-CoA dehydrogenase family protein [Acidimicrobiales bacterium]